jgi:threonine dehydratase
MPHSTITMPDVYSARKNIASIAKRTPLIHSPILSERVDGSVYLKLECLQETGSFKIRGATNKLLSLSKDERARGAITISSGNHGRAVSYVSGKLGINAVICLPETVPSNKREAIRRLGAELVIAGETYDDATETVTRLQGERGLTMVHPYNEPLVIAGQGTIGLELLEDLPEIAGIAFALKSIHAGIRTIGVTMDKGPAMWESLRAGHVVDIVEEPTLADALMGGIIPCDYTFPMIQKYVDDSVLVSEEEIAGAMAFALKEHHLVVEGGGAVGMAALLYGKVGNLGENIAVVLSGSNVDIPVLVDIAQRNHSY